MFLFISSLNCHTTHIHRVVETGKGEFVYILTLYLYSLNHITYTYMYFRGSLSAERHSQMPTGRNKSH